MPIYSWELVRNYETRRCDVFDANGRQITHIVWMNTDTGELVRVKHNADGSLRCDDEGLVLVRETVPAPLWVVWLEDEQ